MSGRSSLLKGMVSHWNILPREVLDWHIPGNVQGQLERGSHQPDLVDGIPSNGRVGVGTQ